MPDDEAGFPALLFLCIGFLCIGLLAMAPFEEVAPVVSSGVMLLEDPSEDIEPPGMEPPDMEPVEGEPGMVPSPIVPLDVVDPCWPAADPVVWVSAGIAANDNMAEAAVNGRMKRM